MYIFLYSLIQCYIVYMNNVNILGRLNVRPEHICYEQAKLFVYSLPCIMNIQTHIMFINKSTTYAIIFGYMNVCSYDCIMQTLYVIWNEYR